MDDIKLTQEIAQEGPAFICEKCEHEIAWSEHLGDRFVERVPGIGKVYKTGITCPECKFFTLVAYISDGLLNARGHLAERALAVQNSDEDSIEYNLGKYGDELDKYKKRFEKFNKQMARRFGTRLIGQEEMEKKKLSQQIKNQQ
jgi:hypothetical protein